MTTKLRCGKTRNFDALPGKGQPFMNTTKTGTLSPEKRTYFCILQGKASGCAGSCVSFFGSFSSNSSAYLWITRPRRDFREATRRD